MDRRSWLWRRKSLENSPGETETSLGSISSHSERFSDDQVYLNHNSQPVESILKVETHENEHKESVDKLSEALMSINAKEELVKQHAKVAEEAVSGWEKAEGEVSALRQQVEILTLKNSTLEDRVVHLDGALKECLRQLRKTREEKSQIAHETIKNKTSVTECHKLEKENSNLKLKLSSMAEELEIRLIERELALQKGNDHESLDRGRFRRNRIDPLLDIDLMDDFLEMEIFAAMPETLKKVENLEVDLKERENELKTSRNRLEEVESKLAKIQDINMKKEAALENELQMLLRKVDNFEMEVQKERDLSRNMGAECQQMENELLKLRRQVECTKLANRAKEIRFLKGKQDMELAMVGSKFAECQKTITSINRQLKTLATLDDFLIDTSDE